MARFSNILSSSPKNTSSYSLYLVVAIGHNKLCAVPGCKRSLAGPTATGTETTNLLIAVKIN